MSWLSSLKSVFSPAQEVKEEEIQTVLQNYLLPDSKDALKERISQLQVQGRVLQLTINTFSDEKEYLQQIHDDLAGALQKCGIEELNLHVVQQKRPTQESSGQGCSSKAPKRIRIYLLCLTLHLSLSRIQITHQFRKQRRNKEMCHFILESRMLF